MTGTRLLPWDSAALLETAEDIAAYLEAAFEEGDPALTRQALGVVARSKGMTALARETRLGRQNPYKALSAEGHPEFTTVLTILHALGPGLTVTPV